MTYSRLLNLVRLGTTLSAFVCTSAVHATTELNYHEFMQRALKDNPKVTEAAIQIQGKGVLVQSVRDSWKPTFSIDGDGTSRSGYSGVSATARMPVYTFGKTDAELNSALREHSEQQAKYIQTVEEVSEEITLSYSTNYILKRKLTVARRNYADHLQILERSRQRKTAQVVSDAEHRNLEARTLQAKAKVLELAKDLNIQHQRLENYIKAKVDEFLPMEDQDIQLDPGRASIDNNPLILLYMAKFELAKADIKKAQKIEAPTLDFYVSTNRMGDRMGNPDPHVGLKFNYQFGQAGARSKNAESQAVIAAQASEMALNNARMEAKNKYDQATQSLTSIEERIKSQRELIDTLEASSSSTNRLYFAGKKTLLELLYILRELSDARLLLVDLELEKISNSIRARSSVGALSAAFNIIAPNAVKKD